MKLDIYPEIHCDDCWEVIHNHFDCPVCKHEYAGTSIYHDMYDLEPGDTMTCEECKTSFILVTKADFLDEFEWRNE